MKKKSGPSPKQRCANASIFLRIKQTKMRTQSVQICAKIILPVHVFLVYLLFSVKNVTRRRHLVSEFQNVSGGESASGPFYCEIGKAGPTGCAKGSFQNATHKTSSHTPAKPCPPSDYVVPPLTDRRTRQLHTFFLVLLV